MFQNTTPALFLSFEDATHSNNPCLDQLGFVGREIWTNEAGVYVPLSGCFHKAQIIQSCTYTYIVSALESTIAPLSEPFISYAVHRHLMNHQPKTLLYVDNTSTGASPRILHFRLRLALFRDYTPTTDSSGVEGLVADSSRDELIRSFVTKLFSDPDDEKKSDPPTFFQESENFSINGGVFNAVGGDMLHETRTVNTGDNNNNTSYINCIFTNSTLPQSKSHCTTSKSGKPGSDEKETYEEEQERISRTPTSTQESNNTQKKSNTIGNTGNTNRKRRWSIMKFTHQIIHHVHHMYHHYLPAVMYYPVPTWVVYYVPCFVPWSLNSGL